MKKLALLTLSSFLVLGACSHSNDTIKDVNNSAHKKIIQMPTNLKGILIA